MKKEKIHYHEGQWFGIPLRGGGYALGIIVRGSYKTKGGLGYFFGPKYLELPGEQDILEKKISDAVLITWFGDLGIITGSWPIIPTSRVFKRDEWPLPKFGRTISLVPNKGFIIEYEENRDGLAKIDKETLVDVEDISGLPIDNHMGGGYVEIKLTHLLK